VDYDTINESLDEMAAYLNVVITAATARIPIDMDHRQALIDAYDALGRRVDQNLRIQNGDAGRLRVQLDEVHAFAADAERVRCQHFPREY
jgi:hypothetical protein